MRVWPYWIDKRDGGKYKLVCFATDVEGRTVYVLQSRVGGLHITSPAPGLEGSVLEQDTSYDWKMEQALSTGHAG